MTDEQAPAEVTPAPEAPVDEATTEEKPAEESADSPIQKAEALLEKIEKANLVTAKLIAKQEQIYSRQLLSGKTDAGEESVKKKETPAEYAAKVMRGEA